MINQAPAPRGVIAFITLEFKEAIRGALACGDEGGDAVGDNEDELVHVSPAFARLSS